MMSRRTPAKGTPASNGYKKAKRQAAKAHKKVARQRTDSGRKWAKRVVADHDALAVEGFRPRFLAKSTMARKAADAAIGATKTALVEMAHKHQRTVRLVNRPTPPWTAQIAGQSQAPPLSNVLPAPRVECLGLGTRTPRLMLVGLVCTRMVLIAEDLISAGE